MAKLNWKVYDSTGAMVGSLLAPADAVIVAYKYDGTVKYRGAWVLWNWRKDSIPHGANTRHAVHVMKQRLREKNIAQLRKQGRTEEDIVRLMGEA